MTRYFILGGLLILSACGSEKGVEIAKPTTFIRYYNSGLHDVAMLVKQTPDNGFIILSSGGDLNGSVNKNGAKIIKTDLYGNQEWEQIYFPSTDNITNDVAKDLIILDKGYLLLGKKNIYILDASGNAILKNEGTFTVLKNIPSLSTKSGGLTLKASSIELKDKTAPSTSNFIVNGTNEDGSMFLGELDRTTLTWKWGNLLGNGSEGANDVKKLFIGSDNSTYFWFHNITQSQKKQVRFTSSKQESDNTYSDNLLGLPNFNQTANETARFGNGFAIIGKTDQKGNNDISYYLRSENGNAFGDSKENNLSGDAFIVTPSIGGGQVTFVLPGDETGNSIATSQEGGLLVLGTVDAQSIRNYTKPSNKNEYYLIKVDGFGNIQPGWPKVYGSKDDDNGASIIQANDGSIVVLGTTTLAGIQTLMLMKTDKDGNIQ